jgi:hypothetical protein
MHRAQCDTAPCPLQMRERLIRLIHSKMLGELA